MKIRQPQPFTFEAGKRAVLLLHGFTGHSADVRMLGRYLEEKGYTSHAPIYRGHGLPPEQLMETNPNMWWEDVVQAYENLRQLGYEEIAVAGLSLGGMMALKLATETKIKAVISMCVPMIFDDKNNLTESFERFVRQYKQFEKKDQATIDHETEQIMEQSVDLFEEIKAFNLSVKEVIDLIYAPTLVIQARNDEVINPESAQYIYDSVETDEKEIKWYEESGHVITLGEERDQLHEDIYMFLEQLEWEQ
ncbi:MAG TPA: alpha/beta fold hydrolase [Pseudogracilibacillus sp.]|nr:alpha/beta fold hydrolase [Pseudogracilibacillus sp.]